MLPKPFELFLIMHYLCIYWFVGVKFLEDPYPAHFFQCLLVVAEVVLGKSLMIGVIARKPFAVR